MSENNETTQTKSEKERFFGLLDFLYESQTVADTVETNDLIDLVKEAYDFTHKELR